MRVCPRCTELYPEDAAYCPVDGAALVRSSDPLVGKTIAQRYRLLSRLGGGGMATVYLARHVMIERLSAVKVLRGDLTQSPSQRDRFLREARAVNRINHENIVEITDFGEWEGLFYLVMEYVAGEPLSRAVPVSWQRAAMIGAQVAAALARAHQMGVVHRDLKPGNILLLRRALGEVAMLTDFGIAKIQDAPPLTLTSQIFGTPGYIAPEYIEGSEADSRADLYSLGVVLYEAVMGRLPYDDRSSTPLMLQVLRDPPAPMERAGLVLPQSFKSLVLRLLSRRPEQRARDAFQVFDELAAILRREGVTSAGTLIFPEPKADSGGPETVRADEEAETSKPLGYLVPLCESGLVRVEAMAARLGELPTKTQSALEEARALTRDLSVASHTVAVEQARIAELERHGRTLRAGLGRAIDELARDLSRVQARVEDAVRRRADAEVRRSVPPSGEHDPKVESALWEHVAYLDEEVRVQALADDLAGEVAALRDHLSRRSEAVEEKLGAARLALEGRVAALRQVGAEAWRAIDDAGRAVGTQALPPDTRPARVSSKARSSLLPSFASRRARARAPRETKAEVSCPCPSAQGLVRSRWRPR